MKTFLKVSAILLCLVSISNAANINKPNSDEDEDEDGSEDVSRPPTPRTLFYLLYSNLTATATATATARRSRKTPWTKIVIPNRPRGSRPEEIGGPI